MIVEVERKEKARLTSQACSHVAHAQIAHLTRYPDKVSLPFILNRETPFLTTIHEKSQLSVGKITGEAKYIRW
jgi:hypothetical protein